MTARLSIRPLRPARRLALLALLGVLIIAAVLLPHHSPSAVLVAHLNASADLKTLPTLETTAQQHGAKVSYLIIPAARAGRQTGQPTESQVLTAIQHLNSPMVPLIVLDENSWAKVQLPTYTRVLGADGNGGESATLAWLLARVVWALVLAVVLLMLVFWPGSAAPSARTAIAAPPAPAPPTPALLTPAPPRPATPTAPAAPATQHESLGWWATSASTAQATTAPAQSSSQPPDNALDLSRFAGGGSVDQAAPQCPHCGAFTVRQVRTDSAANRGYQCEHCGSTWALEPGGEWPTVVVRPRFRTPTDRDHPDLET